MSLSSNDITTKINGYITCIENSGKVYWNKGISTDKDNWGLTDVKCVDDGKKCTSNSFGGGGQCNGFARFIGYLLTGTTVGQDPIVEGTNNFGGGWISTKDNGLAPGDIVEVYDGTNRHAAIVLSISGENISFFELWSSTQYGCELKHGAFNGGWFFDVQNNGIQLKNPTLSDMIRLATRIIKCPSIDKVFCEPPEVLPDGTTNGDDSGADEENTPKVPVTFKKNTDSDGGPVIETREYEVGKPYGEFPSSGARTGYTFAGWWPEANSESGEFTVNTTVPAWDHSLYAHWDAA